MYLQNVRNSIVIIVLLVILLAFNRNFLQIFHHDIYTLNSWFISGEAVGLDCCNESKKIATKEAQDLS